MFVSNSFVREMMELIPETRDSALLRRAVVYLLYSNRYDKRSGRLLLDSEALDTIRGRKARAGDAGKHLLAQLRSILPGFSFEEYSAHPKRGHSRRLVRDGLPQALHDAAYRDLAVSLRSGDPLVDIGTLERLHLGDRSFAERVEGHQVCLPVAPSATAAMILGRMNDTAQPSHGYTKLLKHLPGAVTVAAARPIPRRSGETRRAHTLRQRRSRMRDLAALRQIAVSPRPVYTYSRKGRTDRIFPATLSLLTLSSSTRRYLTQKVGWEELDLASAHLRIAAAVLKVPELDAYLDAAGSVWERLLTEIGADPQDAGIRHAVKTGVYAVLYGMKRSRVPFEFVKRLPRAKKGKNRALAQRFMAHPIVKALLLHRDAMIEALASGQAIETPTGIKVALGTDENARSALSTLMQSYEAAIMAELIDYEREVLANPKTTKDFRIMLWQHDGASVKFWRRRTTHVREIRKRIIAKAKSLGVSMDIHIK